MSKFQDVCVFWKDKEVPMAHYAGVTNVNVSKDGMVILYIQQTSVSPARTIMIPLASIRHLDVEDVPVH